MNTQIVKTKNTKNGNGHINIKVHPPMVRTKQPDEIKLYQIETQETAVTLVSTSQLICNDFNEKSLQEIEDNRQLDAAAKRAAKKQERPPVIPEQRYQLARILDDKGRDCVKAHWVKAAMVTACTRFDDTELHGTEARGAFRVMGDLLPIQFDGLKEKEARSLGLFGPNDEYKRPAGPCGWPVMRRDVVRVGAKKMPDLRYRPGYNNWSIDLIIRFEPALISLPGLYHMIRRAGISIGLCEWRPEKGKSGEFGCFDIKGNR